MVWWMRKNPQANSGNTWSKNNPGKAKKAGTRAILKRHGLTIEQFEEMWERQGGKCANPRCTTTSSKKLLNDRESGLNVDHDHETGKIRGLLCGSCNRALGHAKDDLSRLRGLIEYLQTH
jgi:hypothetical protein